MPDFDFLSVESEYAVCSSAYSHAGKNLFFRFVVFYFFVFRIDNVVVRFLPSAFAAPSACCAFAASS